MEKSPSIPTLVETDSPSVGSPPAQAPKINKRKIYQGLFAIVIVVIIILLIIYRFKILNWFVEVATGVKPLDCDQSSGPYQLECLQQWWNDAGCSTRLKPVGQKSYWDSMPADKVKSDMAQYAALNDTQHLNWCHVDSP